MSSDENLPGTIEEALEWMFDNLDEENRQKLKHLKRGELIRLHFHYGAFIRSALGLWGRNKPLVRALQQEGLQEADGMSGYLIQELWELLQDY